VDEAGFTEWAVGAQRRLLRIAYLLTGDPQSAEDLLQEALLKVALRWDKLASGNPTGYARTVIIRDNISRLRRRREVPFAATADLTAVSSDPEAALVVRRALGRLTRKQRAVVVLRHFEDLPVEEVAKILRVGVGTVKSQNAAALTRLREAAPELRDLIGVQHDRHA
jgi:RNA polymerase sigma-70 factor (sigma-E family)